MTKTQEALDSHIESIKEEIEHLRDALDNHADSFFADQVEWMNERLQKLDDLLELLTNR